MSESKRFIKGTDIPRVAIDPVTLQVLGGALKTLAQEMGLVLYRMSYSSIIREVGGPWSRYRRPSRPSDLRK